MNAENSLVKARDDVYTHNKGYLNIISLTRHQPYQCDCWIKLGIVLFCQQLQMMEIGLLKFRSWS
jgi:hypothetical protein